MHDQNALVHLAYLDGYRGWTAIEKTRVHLLSACLSLEAHETASITKRLLMNTTCNWWTKANVRASKVYDDHSRYFPSETELKAAYQNLVPVIRGEKFHWHDAFRDVGLTDVPQFGRTTHEPADNGLEWLLGELPTEEELRDRQVVIERVRKEREERRRKEEEKEEKKSMSGGGDSFPDSSNAKADQ